MSFSERTEQVRYVSVRCDSCGKLAPYECSSEDKAQQELTASHHEWISLHNYQIHLCKACMFKVLKEWAEGCMQRLADREKEGHPFTSEEIDTLLGNVDKEDTGTGVESTGVDPFSMPDDLNKEMDEALTYFGMTKEDIEKAIADTEQRDNLQKLKDVKSSLELRDQAVACYSGNLSIDFQKDFRPDFHKAYNLYVQFLYGLSFMYNKTLTEVKDYAETEIHKAWLRKNAEENTDDIPF